MKKNAEQLSVLAIDIGGSHIKATILNARGELTMDYDKVETPSPPTPKNVVKSIKSLVNNFPAYNKISVGFPGYIKKGVVITAPNLGTDDWTGFDLQGELRDELGHPARVVNDADMQGLGVVNGEGLELVLTLGTGFGTAFLLDGILLPHLEVSQHPISKGLNYDEYIGDKALAEIGDKKWNKRMHKVFKVLKTVFNYDYLYIGGGNSRKLKMKLDDNMKIVTNQDGIKGGSRLWQENKISGVKIARTSKK
jgi:polyphosphate glucokinase